MRFRRIGHVLLGLLATTAAAQRQEGTIVLAEPAGHTLWVQDADGRSRIGQVDPQEASYLLAGSRWTWKEVDGMWADFWPAGVSHDALADADGEVVNWEAITQGPSIVIFTPWQDASEEQAAVLEERLEQLLRLQADGQPEVRIVLVPLDLEPPTPAALAQRPQQPWITGTAGRLQKLFPKEIEVRDLCQVAIYAKGRVQKLRFSTYWNPLALLKLAVNSARD